MLSTDQLLEIFVVLCIVDHYRYAFSKIGKASAYARSKSGPVRPDSMPTRLSVLITPFQGFVHFLVPTVYMISVIASGFNRPQWMHALALPDAMFGVELDDLRKNAVRVFACVASISLQGVSDDAFLHLDDQFHPIGRREKSRIIHTGPYAWVRHPLYALSLLHSALLTVMLWSYVPFVVVVATAVVFAVKIPIEEEAILRDDAVKEQYRAYMHKVPAKLVPYVW
ncbi:hypothetical protein EV363DRAFT_1403066 [Boletus edulis]|uniref:Protein-S-isoprenylcysteine O-methyltransferase n=1 Tax=Boletus edulis BED1 TaxID=1328754 RepID=A0AAD4BX80_BOLED|nr:hypothetical protein EV363DRAFT_1403066 [Boletus edulis]KAF8442143.1 hypothetical protein L210DRAFT_397743 [Boletus edulis BED1]